MWAFQRLWKHENMEEKASSHAYSLHSDKSLWLDISCKTACMCCFAYYAAEQ